jgi:hypothetical protein
MLLAARPAAADPLSFTLDSTQSYISLAIPNFSISGNNVNVHNQSGGTTWTSGNKAFVGGTLSTDFGGSLSGETMTGIQFIGGANNLFALTSGSYRPNPAAYNATLRGAGGGGVFMNNSTAAGDYGAAASVLLGTAVYFQLLNVTYDAASSPLAASNTVGSGTFATNAALTVGLNSATLTDQGLSLFLVGQIIPNELAVEGPGSLGPLTPNSIDGATYNFTSATNLQIKVPISVPISLNVSGTFINGTASGQFVANAVVPEPSTIALTGLGVLSLVAVARRRRRLDQLRSP